MNRITFFISFYLLAISAYGQVTIGSGETAQMGSLLDIKNITGVTDGSENATGGLGLPRVELKNRKPETGTELAESIGGSGDWDMDEHVGLMVYNVNTECNNSGLYAWSGESWNELTKLSDITGGSRYTDSLALVALYNDTGGDNWTKKTNWLSDKPLNLWQGIELTNAVDACGSLRVSAINLELNNLIGEMPEDIWSLNKLIVLRVRYNALSSIISPKVGNMTELLQLHINNTLFYGSIPKEIGKLKKLRELQAYTCNLSGEIPKEITELESATYIHLSNNNLTGTIPEGFGKLTRMSSLQLSDNKLTGEIPSDIFDRGGSFNYFHVQNNQLTGSLPSNIGGIIDGEIRVSNNQLTGVVPEITKGLNKLYLNDNQFTGPTPIISGSTEHVGELDFSNNAFDAGPIPAWIVNCPELQILNLSNTNRTGEIPEGITTTIWGFITFDFSKNQLSGSIALALERTPTVNFLDLSSNKFTGDLVSVSLTSRQRDVNLSDNQLKGNIPDSFVASWAEYGSEKLNLSKNQFSGVLPSKILYSTKFTPEWVCPQYQEGTTTINPNPFTNYTCP